MTDVPTSLSSAVIYGVVFATLANLSAIYAFHITDPDTMEEIETGLLTDTLRAEAQKQATANIEAEAQALGAIMAARATGQLKYNLRLPMSERENAQVIDAQAQDVTEPKAVQPIATKKSEPNIITQWIRNTARKVRTTSEPHQAPVMVPMQATTAAPGELAETKPTTEATAETKQAVNAAAQSAWLYDNSNTAPANETPNPTQPETTGETK